jgi:nicotinate-nucleotide adenylyltransferase
VRVGVFGGTFDPVHIGHLVLAESAREQLGLHSVLWVPAGDPWRKKEQRVTEARHRVAMVLRAIEGNDAFVLRTDEVEREGPSYTVETLRDIGLGTPGAELFLLLGTDALYDLPNWRSPEEISRLATLAVAVRSGSPGSAGPAIPGELGAVLSIEMPLVDVSSTSIRERCAAGKSIRYLVPGPVLDYIKGNGLYPG